MNPKLLTLLALVTVSFAQGAVGQFIYPGRIYTKSDLIFALAGAILIFVWYRLDANERGYRRSPWLSIAVVGVTIVALPYYFFRSRGARGGSIALGISLICAVCLGLITTAGEYVTYYALQS